MTFITALTLLQFTSAGAALASGAVTVVHVLRGDQHRAFLAACGLCFGALFAIFFNTVAGEMGQ